MQVTGKFTSQRSYPQDITVESHPSGNIDVRAVHGTETNFLLLSHSDALLFRDALDRALNPHQPEDPSDVLREVVRRADANEPKYAHNYLTVGDALNLMPRARAALNGEPRPQ